METTTTTSMNLKSIHPYLALIFLLFSVLSYAQNVGINSTGATPDGSALLDVNASPGNDKGFLMPRLTTTERNAIGSPAEGLQIYNLDCHTINYYNGAVWIPMGNVGNVTTPGGITGSTTPCQNATGETYSIAAVAGATGYNWTVPTGATVTAGQGTTSITVTFGTTDGNVCVTANNACGTSLSSCASITLSGGPVAPTAAAHVPSAAQIVWNWNTVAGATGYKYNTVNNYVTATDNLTSTTYTQTGLTCNTAYTLYVWAYDACGNSSVLTLNETTSSCFTGCIATASTVVQDVVNTYTGKTWMDRNLGASQAATSSTDAAAYGCLYQWGRAAEGHEDRTTDASHLTSTNATTAVPNLGNSWDGKFITEGSSPYDWLATQDPTLWQGVSGTNNPCPSGYRLPSDAELDAERLSWVQAPISSTNNAAGAYASPLKLPVAGYRNSNGALYNVNVGSSGFYWSSTISGADARYLLFYSSSASMNTSRRAHGMSVRCIKD